MYSLNNHTKFATKLLFASINLPFPLFHSYWLARLSIFLGADINDINDFGYQPIHLAAFRDATIPILELLLNKGADINAPDIRKTTPLHHACRIRNTKVAELLVSKGANVNIIDDHGNTPLHFAAWSQIPATAQLLINNKADLNATNTGGETPIAHGLRSLLMSSPNNPIYFEYAISTINELASNGAIIDDNTKQLAEQFQPGWGKELENLSNAFHQKQAKEEETPEFLQNILQESEQFLVRYRGSSNSNTREI